MILTLSTTHQPATDLGFLLMKHPDNVHEKALSFGKATLFFPEASAERCTAAVGGRSRNKQELADQPIPLAVIEHMELDGLGAFEEALFGHARPTTLIITTPNREYNAAFEGMAEGALRHPDHRFEWTRAEFEAWANGVADRHGYRVRFDGIGAGHERFGHPTQMGVFER